MLVLSSGIGDLNKKLEFEKENATNQLNVIAFTEIVGWAFNYFEKQGKGHLVAISSIAGLKRESNGTRIQCFKSVSNKLPGRAQTKGHEL